MFTNCCISYQLTTLLNEISPQSSNCLIGLSLFDEFGHYTSDFVSGKNIDLNLIKKQDLIC